MTTPAPTDPPPILPELPLGLAAACLALAAVCSVADLHDRPVLAGFFLSSAALALVVAVVMARRRSGAATNH